MERNFRTEEILALKSISGIGNQTILRILRGCDNFFDLLDLDFIKFKEITKLKDAERVYELLQKNNENEIIKAVKKIEEYEANNIRVIGINSNYYPNRFRNLNDKPVILFCKGNLELLNWDHSIAVIGTRDCTKTGFKIGFKTASYFAEKNFNIVSGLALGIDTSAHLGALKSKGLTTAVLVEVEKVYPKENRVLAENILLNNGLLISENEPGAFVNKNMFVLRDRLQSALSDAVFPIETDIKGGTMHTVGYTIEYNKPLYCPNLLKINGYDTFNPKAQGVLHLINEGKAMAYTSNDYQFIYNKLTGKESDAAEVKLDHEKVSLLNDSTRNEFLFDLAQYTIEKPINKKIAKKKLKEPKLKITKESKIKKGTN